MKKLSFLTLSLFLISCSQQDNSLHLQTQIDSLSKELQTSYTPHLGDFMITLQMRHAKLWFAGENENWELAEYQIHEMKEVIEQIGEYQENDEEIQMIDIIHPALDSVDLAVEAKDTGLFENSFTILTARCNQCHQATGHEFNFITIPSDIPVVNQQFAPVK